MNEINEMMGFFEKIKQKSVYSNIIYFQRLDTVKGSWILSTARKVLL